MSPKININENKYKKLPNLSDNKFDRAFNSEATTHVAVRAIAFVFIEKNEGVNSCLSRGLRKNKEHHD